MIGRWAAGLALGLAFAGVCGASPAIESRYTSWSHCRVVDHASDNPGPNENPDFVAYRCLGWSGIRVWLTYSDSNKSFLGFGRRQNQSGAFGLTRGQTWKLEWRGAVDRGAFQPFAVIVRANRPEDLESGSFLVVYRLRDDGTSCIVGDTRAGNAAARAIADRARQRFACTEEPQITGDGA
jgi:hypothetical protein